MNILAMDLGKNNTVYCMYNIETSEHTFGKLKTRPQLLHDLMVKHQPDRIVFEICSIAGWIYDIANSLSIEVEVANTNHQAWRWKNVKRKNDRLDALRLAQLSAMHQLPVVHMPEHNVRQKRALIHYRHNLVARRTQIKNSIRCIFDKEGLAMPRGKSSWTKTFIKELRKMSLSIDQCQPDQLWRGQLSIELDMLEAISNSIKQTEDKLDELAVSNKKIQVMLSAAGVGPRLAEAIDAFLDNPHRFRNGKEVGSYAGLTPRQYQSGDMDRQGKISGQGNKLLRSLLVEVSWLGLQHNKWMRETYERIKRGSDSRKKIAITAVARKLLIRCWAMIRDECCWRDNVHGQVA